MMFRYWLLMILVLILSAACTPAAAETTAVEQEKLAGEAHDEADHDEDHEDEDHEDEDHDEHEHEDEDHEHEEADHDHEDEDHDHDEDEHRDHGAHEHGAAELTIAWSGNELAIDLATPAYNVVGFEYTPTSDEEIALLEESIAALEAGDLLLLTPEAECTLIFAEVETEMLESDHADEEKEEESHSDIDVFYNMQCENPEELASLDAGPLFDRFPNFAELDVQWISDTMQSAAELTADNPVVSLQ